MSNLFDEEPIATVIIIVVATICAVAITIPPFGEIGEHRYKQIVEWTDEVPELKPFVQQRLQDDNITRFEYKQIESAYTNHVRDEYKDKLR